MAIDGAEAVVVGEGRSITIQHGLFSNSFSGYGVHIYTISLTGDR